MQIVLQAHGGKLSDSWMNNLQKGLNDCMSTIKDSLFYENLSFGVVTYISVHRQMILYDILYSEKEYALLRK